jgi:hypothetical protein
VVQRGQKSRRGPVAVRHFVFQTLVFWRRPRSGAMFVLLQVWSINASRGGSIVL